MIQKSKLYIKLMLALVILGASILLLMTIDIGRFTIIVQAVESVAIILFWAILYLLIKVTVFDKYQEKHQLEAPRIFVTISRFLFIVFAILSIMVVVFDQSLMSVATLGGLVGAGVTFAVGSLILDTFSGVVLELEGPLDINDWIKVDENREGMIISVNWRTVVLKTSDETIIIVPHGDLTKGFVNYSKPENAYWETIEIGMDHSLPVERAERIMRAGIMKTPSIHDHQCAVFAKTVSESGITYQLRFMVADRQNSHKVRHDVIQSVTNHLHDCNMRVSEGLGEYAVVRGGKPFKEEDPVDVKSLVERVDFMKSLSKVLAVKIAERASHHHFEEGEIIVREGDAGDSVFLIAEGVASVSIAYANEAGEPREKHLFNLGFGDCFGEMSLFLNDPRSATVRAATNCLVYEISHDLIKESVKGDPEIFVKMVNDAKAKKEKNIAMKEQMSQMKEHHYDEKKGLLGHLKDLFS